MSGTEDRYKKLFDNINNSIDLVLLLQGFLSNSVTDIALSDLNQKLTENSQSYLDKIKQCYIDYSDIKQEDFKKQLELDSQMMLKAKINNNFEEYCRSACLQIEAALEHFCLYLCDQNESLKYPIFLNKDHFWSTQNIDPNRFNKMTAYDFWYEETYKKERDIRDPEYNNILYIMNIRDAASHRTLGHISFEDKLGKIISNSDTLRYTKQFYEKQNFNLVKKRTENLVRNILINQF